MPKDPVRAIRPPAETWRDVAMIPLRGAFYLIAGLFVIVVALMVIFAITAVANFFMGLVFVPLAILIGLACIRDWWKGRTR